MAGTKARRGGDEQRGQEAAESWAVKKTILNAAGLRAAQGDGNLKLFCVSVNLVDMISVSCHGAGCHVGVPLPL